jgi:hypothetical protein
MQTSIQEKPKCPYCGAKANLVEGSAIYGPGYQYSAGLYWICRPCEAYVGCHKGTKDPMGSMAKPELRRMRMKAHAAFDVIWKTKRMKRKDAYAMLAHDLGIPFHSCHIAYFDEEQCRKTVEASGRIMRLFDKTASETLQDAIERLKANPPAPVWHDPEAKDEGKDEESEK